MKKKFKVDIIIELKDGVLDPQGKATEQSLTHLGFDDFANVRIGKAINLQISAASHDNAIKIADDMCQKLLANQVMEKYHIDIEEI